MNALAESKKIKKKRKAVFRKIAAPAWLAALFLALLLLPAPEGKAADAQSGEALPQEEADICTNALLSASVSDWPAGPEIAPFAGVLMDLDTGTVLYAKDAHRQHYPASITKILTALVAIENGDPQQTVVFSYNAVHNIEAGSANIGMKEGEEISLDTALRCMMCASANECAYAIAESVGGTYEHFIELMNEKAAALGCTDSHFSNPHGLYDATHYVSAQDMALIAAAAYEEPLFREICCLSTYTRPVTAQVNNPWLMSNHHKMFRTDSAYYYNGCTGGKTGFTNEAHNTLVTYAERDGKRLVCVLLHGEGVQVYEATAALFDWGFSAFTHEDLASVAAPGVASSSVDGAVAVLPADGDGTAITTAVVYDGSRQGTLSVYYNGYAVGYGRINLTDAYMAEQTEENRKTQATEADPEADLSEDLKSLRPERIVFPALVLLLLLTAILWFFHRMRKRKAAGGASEAKQDKSNQTAARAERTEDV